MYVQVVTHPASRLVRTARVLVAFVTVWCTGCAGFEPLVNAALGSGAGMVCASEMTPPAASGAAAAPESRSVAAIAAPAKADFSCGCTSCHAVTLVAAVAPSFTSSVDARVEQSPVAPESMTRAPLIPPPQPAS
jgi:hypothetical protein